ncbi:hypothetical protein [Nocardiopsis metallicus]|uniref:Uncharacterized protein n=1 Tax=Nocardiopsis metallicus TaxID=179819 RepID=A0A840W4L8_9ACTN|nr:hypothetical protein [Nocardiopsis metallicus]MBB5491910.1 hypothetical protein [Nocardiopsis metallicus]
MTDLLLPALSWAVLTLFAASQSWELLRDGRGAEKPRAFPDRWGLFGRGALVALFTVIPLYFNQWLVVPAALWWVNVAVLAVTFAVGAARWHTLPRSAADEGARGRRRRALFTSALTVSFVLFLAL